MCAVAHVAEGADGDAHGLVLVCEGHWGMSGTVEGGAEGWSEWVGKRRDERTSSPLGIQEAHEFHPHHATPFTCVPSPIQILSSRPLLLQSRAPELLPNELVQQPPLEFERLRARQLSTTWESRPLTADTALSKQI